MTKTKALALVRAERLRQEALARLGSFPEQRLLVAQALALAEGALKKERFDHE